MHTNVKRLTLGALVAGTMLISGCSTMKMMVDRPFGNSVDVAESEVLWKQLQADGYNTAESTLFEGNTPHGKIVEALEGKINGKTVLVKRNYNGDDITIDKVKENRSKYLSAITVMQKREAGYDEENQNWFYAMYNPDGSVHKRMMMIPMAGRVAKGVEMESCISCHSAMPDYRFVTDKTLIKQIM